MRVARAVSRHATPASRVLDFGCGDGDLIRLVAPGVRVADGIDIDKGKLKRAANIGVPDNTRLGTFDDAVRWVADEAPYDIVILSQVLEHVADVVRDEVFDQLRELTHSRSTIIVEVPIESGPILIVKTIGGHALRILTRGNYRREVYTVKELRERMSIEHAPHVRPVHPSGTQQYWGHRDFSVRNLERYLDERCIIRNRDFIPVRSFRYVNLQALYECEWRPDAS